MDRVDDLDRAFGTHIGLIRRAKKLSLREVAERVGMDHTYLCKIERGKMPPPGAEMVEKIADVLGLDRNELTLMSGHLPSPLRALAFDNKYAREFLARTANDLATDGWAQLADVLDSWNDDLALDEDA